MGWWTALFSPTTWMVVGSVAAVVGSLAAIVSVMFLLTGAIAGNRVNNDEHGELSRDIEAVQAGQDELRTNVQTIQAGQDELRTNVQAIQAGQDELQADVRTLVETLSAPPRNTDN